MGVRRAVIDDVAEVARVQTASWEGVYRGLMPDSILERITVERREQMLSRYMSDRPANTALLVAEVESEIVGMAWIGPSRDDDHADGAVGQLFAIYVDPVHWDAGHGRELMIRALAEMRNLGFQEASLWVLDNNERGRGFYERGGWLADGAVKIDESFGDPLREVRYVIDL